MEKVVGFAGYECEDMVLYLARIMSALGKRVVIVDRTEQEMLLEILGMQKQQESAVREGYFYGVWITEQNVDDEEYDMIFLVFGYRLLHPKLYECEALIMVTDGVPAHASLFRKLGRWERKQYLVMRNLVPMRHRKEYLARLAENEQNYCEIPYEEKDIRMRYSLGAYTVCAVKQLSSGMKRALVLLTTFLVPDYQEKKICEIMKKL